ncbi:MAG: TIM44-like domain-containing protein, partial [Clostridia bacterium]|nr:TIM44-like domain-containing protein [Clostridia bacterium]
INKMPKYTPYRSTGNNGSGKYSGTKHNQTPVAPGPEATPASSLCSIEELSSIDPDFSAESMKEWISNAYVRMQNAWQAKDLSSVESLFSGAYFAQMETQLDNNYIKAGRTNIIENIAVLGVELVGWRKEADVTVLIAQVSTRISDYTVDDETGDVIKGDPSKEKFMKYEWSLSRSAASKTECGDGVSAKNCPNCGAPLNINKSSVCEYCGSVVKSSRHDWVINSIKGLAQRTV